MLNLLVQACMSFCTDVEFFGVFHYHLHDVLAVGATIGTETSHTHGEKLHHLEEMAVGLSLLKAYVYITVAVL